MTRPPEASGGNGSGDRDSSFVLRTSHFLVRLGRLRFDDFRLLDAPTLRSVLSSTLRSALCTLDSDLSSLWPLSLANAPHVLCRLQSELPDLDPALYRWPGDVTLERIHEAQDALVRQFAFELLRAKAPPLWDSLPWNEWDFEPLIRRFPLWRTRFLLAGDGTSVILPRLRKSAGVVICEPLPFLRRYLEARAAKEKAKRIRLLGDSSLVTTHPADVALLGSFSIPSASIPSSLNPFLSVPHLFLVENNPLRPPLDPAEMQSLGFTRSEVEVRTLGPRPLWTRAS
jgi:hypothetical protein